ncbi:type II toxin-antitoxin system VapC family toxin [Geoalkalibacter halelectricus]|nr:type II toxin-antitoxin system VapC family toxin [Geoalkalibacter halelectricus]
MDTNAVISLLAGNHQLAEKLDAADYVGISVITFLEFLAFEGLSEEDHACFVEFCSRVEVVALDPEDTGLMKLALDLRSLHRLKLPDAVIGATALARNAHLVTNDSHFSGISLLSVVEC